MNDDLVLDSFYDEMEKIAFNFRGGFNAVKQTANKMKGGFLKGLGDKAVGTMDSGAAFTKSLALGEGKGAKVALNSADDLANLAKTPNQLVATNVEGVGGKIGGQELQQKVTGKAEELSKQKMTSQVDDALETMKVDPSKREAVKKELQTKIEKGEEITSQDFKNALKKHELNQFATATETGTPLMDNLNKVDEMVNNAKLQSIQKGDATSEALSLVKKELGITDNAMAGTAEDFTESIILNPKATAENSLSLPDLLTYGGINALGFAGQHGEMIAKGTALGLGGLGIYSIL